ncbi:MAG: DUF512 domain-containing protein, partial [Firmicutes bacterium]|nr:DUF512 domain-containing protein [Bacillota bacterium]
GRDIIATMQRRYEDQRVIIPTVLLRDGQEVLLDDKSLEDIQTSTGADIHLADGVTSMVEAVIAT